MPEITSTYRLQLSGSFRFGDALKALDYIKGLGISHLYLSPITEARKGSSHFYDVVDYSKVSEQLGGERDLISLSRACQSGGMGIIIDFVPNHMAYSPENVFLRDFMVNGFASRYSTYLDLRHSGQEDWKVAFPFLPEPYDACLEKGTLTFVAGDSPGLVTPSGTWPVPRDVAGELKNFPRRGDGTIEANKTEKHRLVRMLNMHPMYWRYGNAQINYRRFFMVNDLIAVRQENENAFRDTHALLFRLASEGIIDGVRIDHIDGLYDPTGYLQSIRSRLGGLKVYVEKVLSRNEALHPDWPVEGTTGYDFMYALDSFLVSNDGFSQVLRTYLGLTGQASFGKVVEECKLANIEGGLRPDVDFVSSTLKKAMEGYPEAYDAPLEEYKKFVVEFLVRAGRYRYYLSGRVSSEIQEIMEQIPGQVSRVISEHLGDRRLVDAVRRLQQLCVSCHAKSVEDMAFYRYTPLISICEVGHDPSHPASSHEEFTRFIEGRSRWPLSMNATSTHDTKLGEDLRWRVTAISYFADEYTAHLVRYARTFPDVRAEHLSAALQLAIALHGNGHVYERLTAHLTKAMRESSLVTSWETPDTGYESRVTGIAREMMEDGGLGAISEKVRLLANEISLFATACKVICPGVPDFYQGSEVGNFSFVDPDNRRQMDFEALGQGRREGEEVPWKQEMVRKSLSLFRNGRGSVRLLGAFKDSGRLWVHSTDGSVEAFALLSVCGSEVQLPPGNWRSMRDGNIYAGMYSPGRTYADLLWRELN